MIRDLICPLLFKIPKMMGRQTAVLLKSPFLTIILPIKLCVFAFLHYLCINFD